MRNSVMPFLLYLDLLELHARAPAVCDPEQIRPLIEKLHQLSKGLLPCAGAQATTTAPGIAHLRSRWQTVGASVTPSPTVRRRVLLIDDSIALTAALALRFAIDDRFDCLPPLHSLDDALTRITALEPALVVLDLNLPGAARPLDLVRALRAQQSSVQVVILTGNPSTATVEAARDSGAAGFIAKGISSDRLIAALARVGAGEFVLELDGG